MKGHYLILAFAAILKIAQCEIKTNKKLHELMSPEDRKIFFHLQDDKIPKYSIINLDWPVRHKRSDDSISFTIKTLNQNINLDLSKPNDLIVDQSLVLYTITRDIQYYCTPSFPLKNTAHQIYQDEKNLATLLVAKDKKDRFQIKRGIIGSKNITVDPVPEQYLKELGLNSNQTYYVVKEYKGFLKSIPKVINTEALERSKRSQGVGVPGVIYPEILLLIDRVSADAIQRQNPRDEFHMQHYLIAFWSQVNMLYKSLDRPKYKLSLAGIVIGDASALSFIKRNIGQALTNGQNELSYENALDSMGRWLYSLKPCIPLDSYDIAVYQTLYESYLIKDIFSKTKKLGIALLSQACRINYYQQSVSKVSIVYDSGNFGGIQTAAHEVAHLLGAGHDSDYRCQDSRNIMLPSYEENQNAWSECSLQGFGQFLMTNPTCLYNVPKQYQIGNRPTNNNNNGLTEYPASPNPASGQPNPSNNPNVPEYGRFDVDYNHPFMRIDQSAFVLDPRRIPNNKWIMISFDGKSFNIYLAVRKS